MSLPRKMTVNCSKCGKPIEITVFQSVNTNYVEDIARQVITGELFNISCSHCGFVSHLEYDILYNDMNHDAMIWVIHDNTPEFESRIAEVRKTDIVPLKMTRIVTDINGLREKVSCLEKHRDDRVIELCKMYVTYNMLSKQPDFDFRNAYYTVDGDKELVLLYDCNGKEYTCELPGKLYDLVNDMYFNSSYPSQFDGNYAIVDSNWAEKIFHSLIQAKSEEIKVANSPKQPENMLDNNQELRCPKCNKELPTDSEFCQYCGNRISESVRHITFVKEGTVHKDLGTEKSIQTEIIQGNNKKTKRRIRPAIIITAVVLALILVAGILSISFSAYYDRLYKDLSEAMHAVDYYHYNSNNMEIENLINDLPSDYKDVEEIKKQHNQIDKLVKIIESVERWSDKDSEEIREAYAELYEFNKQHDNWDLREYLEGVLENSFSMFVFGKEWENANYSFQWYEDGDGDGERLSTDLPNEMDSNKHYYFYYAYDDGSGILNPRQFGYENVNNSADKFLAYRIVNVSYTGGTWQIRIYCYSNSRTYTLE